MPSLPGGKTGNLSCGSIVILIILFLVYFFMSRGGGTDTPTGGDFVQTREPSQPTQAALIQPTRTQSKPAQAQPTRAPGAIAGGDTWTIMLYQDADDKILEKDIYLDLNEAERVGSTDNVQIVTQIDRFRGGYQGDGGWDGTRRYYVTQDDDLEQVGSELLEDMGEANMADGNTLVDFVTWAIETYPADKYALILSDHGMGWPGGWSDPTSSKTDRSMPLASAIGDQLYLSEIDQALGEIRSQSGLDKFELIGMDACLMAHLEVFSDLAKHARYAITSQETEPSLGWAYASFLAALNENPAMNGAELGKAIVESYIDDDERIVDDRARADFVGPNNVLGSLFGASSVPSASQVSRQLTPNITLSVIDLSLIPELMDRFNTFAFALQDANPRDVGQARSYAQSFTSIFGKQVPPSYIDLGHFAQLAGRTGGQRSVGEASNALIDVIGQAVVAERHGQNKQGATGISIYFPNSDLYRTLEAGPASYNVAAQGFVQASLWDEYLAYFYTNRPFTRDEVAVVAPERSATIQAPTEGGIQITQVQASSNAVAPGDSIHLESDISGENIGYIRLMVGYLDQANRSIYIIDSDYLDSSDTRELNGVFYPDWGTGAFTLAFEWEPIVFAIDDGQTQAVALLNPESYGRTAEEAVYSVEGTYTFADGGESRYARLYFSNGQLQRVMGFTGQNGTGAPWEITPQRGDTVTILERWMDLDEQGKVVETVQQEGETLTFGDKMFTWEELYAAPGQYVVGFMVEDLDGNQQTSFTQVTVR